MRDPRRPPRRMETSWALRFRTTEEDGSPVHAWLFYFGLVPFPLWWIGAVWRVPQTRVVGGSDTEKAVPLDDPQIEFGALLSFFRGCGRSSHGDAQMRGRGDFAAALWVLSRYLHTSPLLSALPYLRVGDKSPLAPHWFPTTTFFLH